MNSIARLLFRGVALSALIVGVTSSPVRADLVVGLTQSNSLITFDTTTPGATTAPVTVTGLGGGEVLLGIDFRPATRQLFGLGSGSNLYTIDPLTGAATLVAALTATLNGTSFGVDFNPVVDRFRIVSDANQNLRVNPANGVTIVDGNLNPGDPNVVGAAYANSVPGVVTATTLFVLDSSVDDLFIQAPPNAGGLVLVGDLGVDFNDQVGFDILGARSAFASLNTGGPATGFYSIDLTTGSASLIGDVGGGLLLADIAIAIPEPGTMGLLFGGLAGLAWARRRRAS